MKQNGAVAAYQIIQIPLHPSLIELRRGKDSGTILLQRKTRKGEEEKKKMHRGKENKIYRAMAACCPMASSQREIFREVCSMVAKKSQNTINSFQGIVSEGETGYSKVAM